MYITIRKPLRKRIFRTRACENKNQPLVFFFTSARVKMRFRKRFRIVIYIVI